MLFCSCNWSQLLLNSIRVLLACLFVVRRSNCATTSANEYCGDDCITGGSAIAYFTTYGFKGTVKVVNGHVNVTISMADFDFDDISDYGGRSCFNGGIYYGIYDTWDHSTDTSRLGEDQCGSDYTGMRWDPWLACSVLSHNEYCQSNGECVYAGSRDGDSDDDSESLTDNLYSCNELNYKNDPFSCEIGDWSGKYGLLYYNSKTKMLEGGGSSAYEVDGYDLTTKSIVFRCHDQTRLFCGKFVPYDDNSENEANTMKPAQNGTYSKIAYFGDNSYIKLTYYHTYDIVLDYNDITVPGTCGTEIYYRIFTDYSDTLGCSQGSGNFYDPTITCDENSHMTEVNSYCDNTERCGDADYFYSCNYSTNIYQRLKCAPGDLADKYGSIDISESSNFYYNISGTDSMMIPLSKLDGKSVVLQCKKNYAIIACAEWEDYTADKGKYGTVVISNSGSTADDNNDDSGSSSSSDSSSGFLGISDTASTILLVLFLLSIVPCVKHFRDKKQKEKEMLAGRNKTGDPHAVTGGSGGGGGDGTTSGSGHASRSRSHSRTHSRTQSRTHSRRGSVDSRTGSVRNGMVNTSPNPNMQMNNYNMNNMNIMNTMNNMNTQIQYHDNHLGMNAYQPTPSQYDGSEYNDYEPNNNMNNMNNGGYQDVAYNNYDPNMQNGNEYYEDNGVVNNGQYMDNGQYVDDGQMGGGGYVDENGQYVEDNGQYVEEYNNNEYNDQQYQNEQFDANASQYSHAQSSY